MNTKILIKRIFIVIVIFMTGCLNFPETYPSVLMSQTPLIESNVTPLNLPTAIPTTTAYPILLPAEAKRVILGLVQNNDDCHLPCLWGMTPGETSFETARIFIRQFDEIRTDDIEIGSNDYGDTGGVGMTYKEKDIYIVIHLSYYQNDDKPQIDSLEMYTNSMIDVGIDPITQGPALAPIWGNPTFNQELESYLLPTILTEYGMPSEVLIVTFPDDPDRTDIKFQEFKVGLLYSGEGFFIEYESLREKQGSSFIGCPSKAHIKVTTWDAKSNLSLKDALRRNVDYYKTLEEATSMSIEEFYQEYKNKEFTPCIETPISAWR